MEIPREYVERFAKMERALTEDVQKRLVDALANVDVGDIATARNQIIALMDTLLGPYTDSAAAVAAAFYDGLRDWFGISDGFAAEVVSGRNPEATGEAVRAFMQMQVDGKPKETLENLLVSRAGFEMKHAVNECIVRNAKRDPKKPKWARIPVGTETCEFCIMLASRGFEYHEKDVVEHVHANCDCQIVPSWDKTPSVAGYDPDHYLDVYRHPGNYPEYRNARLERRRELYREKKGNQ